MFWRVTMFVTDIVVAVDSSEFWKVSEGLLSISLF